MWPYHFGVSPHPLQTLCVSHTGDRDHDTLLLQPWRLPVSETTLCVLYPLVPSGLATGPLHWLFGQPGTLPPRLITDSFLISDLRLAS